MDGRQRLASYLQEHGAQFSVVVHPETYTAQEVAAAEHVPGKNFVKVVMVKADDSLVMLCVPAHHEIEFDTAAKAVGAERVRLAAEEEFGAVFEDCEVGAMPPFGNLYDVPVIIDESLAADEYIVFNAGNHRETFRMSFQDYERLVHPRRGTFSHVTY